MNDVDTAVNCFYDRDNCAQAILSTFGPRLGLDKELSLKLTEVFSGGMAHTGNICGAVTGAFMVIGLKFSDLDVKHQEAMHDRAKEFIRKFKEKYHSIICRELINYDLTTIKNRKHATERKIFKNCPKYVRDAAEILENMLY
ncbi:MAG: C-GCAxxG-C-C family protein [Promethearchaeota archaeon]